jgi:hypothetical protein
MQSLTIPQLKEYCKANHVDYPAGMSKTTALQYIAGCLAEPRRPMIPWSWPEIYPAIVDVQSTAFQHLQEYGWTVIDLPGWNNSYVSRFFDWLESFGTAFDRTNIKTWTTANMPAATHGIFKQFIGHTKFCWDIRSLCAPAFAALYNIPAADLLCSFDGGCLLKPKSLPPKHWFHSDDGGTLLLERTDQIYTQYLQSHPSYGYKWEVCDMADPLLQNRRLIKICAPAGSLILFNGRTFHQNLPPSPNSETVRMCTYVSMQPRSCASAAELKKRIKLYEEGRMTGHWCYGHYFKANPKAPRVYGGVQNLEPEVVEIAELDALQRSLVGY